MALARLTADLNAELEIVRGPGEDEFILRHIVGGALADVPNDASLEIRCDSCGNWNSWVGVKPVDAGQWSEWVCRDCAGTENGEVAR